MNTTSQPSFCPQVEARTVVRVERDHQVSPAHPHCSEEQLGLKMRWVGLRESLFQSAHNGTGMVMPQMFVE